MSNPSIWEIQQHLKKKKKARQLLPVFKAHASRSAKVLGFMGCAVFMVYCLTNTNAPCLFSSLPILLKHFLSLMITELANSATCPTFNQQPQEAPSYMGRIWGYRDPISGPYFITSGTYNSVHPFKSLISYCEIVPSK